MHTEGDIRRAIRPLLELYGQLNTSEVKERIEEVMTFDDEDNEPSGSRKESKIVQRIGNIISHQVEEKKYYPEGFIVDKSYSPALFLPVRGLSGNLKPISQKENEAKKKKKHGKKYAQRRATKQDWDAINEKRAAIGMSGEEFVLQYERDVVKAFDEASVDRVIHLSQEQGDGLGYDILSMDKHGEPKYIEVKTTAGSADSPFYMSENERLFFEENPDHAFLYRVFDFNKEGRHGKIKEIPAKTLLSDYAFDPVTYRVYKK